MKKFTLLLLTLFSAIACYSQISITAEEVIGIGDVVMQANDADPDPSIMPGDAGANVSWDFSALTISDQDTLTLMHPDDTPFGGNFPEANLAMSITDSGFMYMIKNTDMMSWVGVVFEAELRAIMDPMEEVVVEVVPGDIVADFPIEYGNSMNDSYYMMFEMASNDPGVDSVRWKMSTVETEEYDAWGQLTLPLGTYNVLRSHSTSTSYDSIWVKTPLGWTFTFGSQSESESFNWWSDDPGTGFVIASLYVEESGAVTSASFLKEPVIQSIGENTAGQINAELFPNPVEDILYVSFEEAFTGKIKIIDLTGQLIEEISINSRKISLDMTQQSDGIYFYKILSEKGITLRSGKIVKQ